MPSKLLHLVAGYGHMHQTKYTHQTIHTRLELPDDIHQTIHTRMHSNVLNDGVGSTDL